MGEIYKHSAAGHTSRTCSSAGIIGAQVCSRVTCSTLIRSQIRYREPQRVSMNSEVESPDRRFDVRRCKRRESGLCMLSHEDTCLASGWPTNRQQLGTSRLNERTGDHAHIHRVRFSGPLMNGAALDANSCADGRIPGRNLALAVGLDAVEADGELRDHGYPR